MQSIFVKISSAHSSGDSWMQFNSTKGRDLGNDFIENAKQINWEILDQLPRDKSDKMFEFRYGK